METMLRFLCVDGPELDNGLEMMGMKRGKKTAEDIKRKVNEKGQHQTCSFQPKTHCGWKKNMWEKSREKDREWSSGPQGSSENLYFSESDKHEPPKVPASLDGKWNNPSFEERN